MFDNISHPTELCKSTRILHSRFLRVTQYRKNSLQYESCLEGAEQPDFNDKEWDLISLPDGIEYVPSEASGCVNYQGEVWYRKHFTPEETWKGKQLFLHFEAIMGKAKVWINGTLVNEHYGGFLPVIANVTEYLNYEEDNVIAVWADILLIPEEFIEIAG